LVCVSRYPLNTTTAGRVIPVPPVVIMMVMVIAIEARWSGDIPREGELNNRVP
jgi:hypothetical protein